LHKAGSEQASHPAVVGKFQVRQSSVVGYRSSVPVSSGFEFLGTR